MSLKKCTVGIHKNCVELSNGQMRLAVTTQVGPRIIGCFIGKKNPVNMFAVLPAVAMAEPANGFVLYGGHRLWHSPEACPRSYEPDNTPVTVTESETGVEFAMDEDIFTGISKKILVEPLSNGLFCVTHTIQNCGMFPVEIAPWALSMMAPGGTVVIPQGRDPEGYPYAPDRSLNLWPYSDFKDKRLDIGADYIMVHSDTKSKKSFKLGFNDMSGWVAYANHGQALVKYFDVDDSAEYPDNGCTVECYTCKDFTEMETLGVLDTVEPEECIQHIEYWQAMDGIGEIKSEADVEKYIVPNLLVSDCCCEEEECEEEGCCGGHDHGHDCDCGCEEEGHHKHCKKR